MGRHTINLLVVLSLLGAATSACAADPRAARAASWQAHLANVAFYFDNNDAGVINSLANFREDCQITMSYDPSLDRLAALMFKFTHAGKELASIEGNFESTFVAENGTLYFAQFDEISSGCSVLAFDTTTGKKRWETQLKGIGPVTRSKYSNRVAMNFEPSLPDSQDSTSESLVITGSESAGDYIEVLDAETGIMLAHRIYRHVY